MASSQEQSILATAMKANIMEKGFIQKGKARPKEPYNQFCDEIPVISLAGIDDGDKMTGSGGRREIIREKVVAACEEWGAFQVVDHCFDPQLITQMTDLSKQFFALPHDYKLSYYKKGDIRNGFFVSSHVQEKVANWREVFIYSSYPMKERDYSRWPDKPTEWKSVMEKFSMKMMELTHKLLEILSESMCFESDKVAKASGELAQKLIINYYQKCPQPDSALGLRRHTDLGSITLLLQDQVGGLQVTKDGGDNWVTVKPIKGAIVVILGDFAYYLSNGRFKSAVHRAVVNNESARYSIAAHAYPSSEAIVYPLKVEKGMKPIFDKPLTFADLYKATMKFHVEWSKLEESVPNKKLTQEDIVKYIWHYGDEFKSFEEMLA